MRERTDRNKGWSQECDWGSQAFPAAKEKMQSSIVNPKGPFKSDQSVSESLTWVAERQEGLS
jgi:hypothetical protein